MFLFRRTVAFLWGLLALYFRWFWRRDNNAEVWRLQLLEYLIVSYDFSVFPEAVQRRWHALAIFS